MSRLPFDPFMPPPPGRQTLHARLIWTTQVQLWRYTNGGLITGPPPTYPDPESPSVTSPPVTATVKRAKRKTKANKAT
jgi:hypothetical protein